MFLHPSSLFTLSGALALVAAAPSSDLYKRIATVVLADSDNTGIVSGKVWSNATLLFQSSGELTHYNCPPAVLISCALSLYPALRTGLSPIAND